MEFLVISIVFLVLLLLVVWRPFFKQKNLVESSSVNNHINVRDEMNVRLYHEHKAEIEKDHREGSIDDENYEYLLSELNNTLLQDIESSEGTQLSHDPVKKFSPFWPLGLSFFIIVFSVLLYQQQGSFKQLTQLPEGHGQKQQTAQEQRLEERQSEAMVHIKKLQSHIESNPEDTEAWYNLGQTFVAVGAFDQAVMAFKRVISIEGEHADLLGAIAQATYYKNEQRINTEVQSYIDKALALDINDPSTNILLGMDNFINQEYQQAIDYWQRIIDANNPSVNITALKEAVAEANTRLNHNTDAVNSSNASAQNKTNKAIPDGPELSINVSLSAEVHQQLSQGQDRIVFVYAVPTNGQRMPLAAVKVNASDLPLSVVLNNSQAMSPASNLSSVDKVHVYAVVSMSGGVGIKQGDFKAEVLNVDVNHKEALDLVVNTLVE